MSRRFSEDDARRIFARVAEQQARTAPDTDGLSLTDLEDAARAAGLDPALVALAAAELDAPPARGARRLAGAPVEVLASRLVPGDLSDETWAGMVGAARAQFGHAGMAGQVGRRREWTLVSGGPKNGVTTQLVAEPVAGGIRLSLSQSIRDMAFGFTVGGSITAVLALVFTALAALGVEPELWIPAVILVAQTLLFLGGTQVGTRLWHGRRTEQFERLLDRLDLVARATDAPAPLAAEPPARERAPRLGDALDDLPDDVTGDDLEGSPREGAPTGRSRSRS